MDYFPLSVNYQEKYYAGGKIPGGFFKREARPTESEQLISRLIDRPIRPLFPGAFKNEVQLLPTVISYDKENQPDILATVVGAKKVNPDMDYFPLSVNYQEKYYAGGKIPGGFFKREARPTESEQLISRLIDRPIRPLFPGEFKNEVQLLPTVISYDKENQPDILVPATTKSKVEFSNSAFDWLRMYLPST